MGDHGEIWGFDQENWIKQAEAILSIPLTTEEGRTKRLNFFPRADECILDSQGRFILPSEFMVKLNVSLEVLLIGAGDHFEIWGEADWLKENKTI